MITVFAVNAVQGSGEMKMTKFEEELNKKMDLKEVPMYFTQSGCSMTRKTYIETNWVFDTYKNWHSDEEFQAKEKEIKRLRKINHLYKKAKGNAERLAVDRGERLNQAQDELASLEPQIQQQALPVVPSFIGEWLDSNNLAGLLDEWYCHHEEMPSHIREYFERLPYKGPNNLSEMENNIVTFITRAKLDGYQVEKPQLFYLRDELTGQFLAKDNQFKDKDRYFFWTGADPLTHSIGTAWKLTFTQAEIDSMQTGSYEQIEVAE